MPTVPTSTVLLSAILLAAAGCGSDDSSGPSKGGIVISVTATGVDADVYPFTVAVDGSGSRSVSVGTSTTITGLDPGGHVVRMEGVAENCQLSGPDTKTVSVVAGEDVPCSFSVSCDAIVEGTWSYSLSIDPGVPCTITETLSLSQVHSSFGGTATGGWISCPLAGIDESVTDPVVRNGVTKQAHVAFDFDNSLVHHSGMYSGNRMNGSVVFQFPEGAVTGSWSATRTSGVALDRHAEVVDVSPGAVAPPGAIADRIRRVRP